MLFVFLQLKISDQTYSLGAFLGKDPDEIKQQKQEKLEQQVTDVSKLIKSQRSYILQPCLTHSPIHHFQIIPYSKTLQPTTEM